MEQFIQNILKKVANLKHNMEMAEGCCDTGYNPFINLLEEIQEIEDFLKMQIEFDKRNVKSWQNMENVEVEQKGYFGNNLVDLSDAVKYFNSEFFGKLENINSDGEYPFEKSDIDFNFRYFYPIDL